MAMMDILTVTMNPAVDIATSTNRVIPTHNSGAACRSSTPAVAAALEEGVYLVKPSLRELRDFTGAPA